MRNFADILRHKPFTMTDNEGNAYRVTLKQYAPTMRYEVIVEGTVVGWGFATKEDAYARAYEAVREGGHPFSRNEEETR